MLSLFRQNKDYFIFRFFCSYSLYIMLSEQFDLSLTHRRLCSPSYLMRSFRSNSCHFIWLHAIVSSASQKDEEKEIILIFCIDKSFSSPGLWRREGYVNVKLRKCSNRSRDCFLLLCENSCHVCYHNQHNSILICSNFQTIETIHRCQHWSTHTW